MAKPHLLERLSFGLVVAWAACGLPAASQAAGLTISITPASGSLPVTLADKLGFFTDEGLAVTVVACASGPECLRSLFAKRSQLAVVTELPVVMASFTRSDFAVVGSLASANGNIRVIARKSAGITDAASLTGKRVGVIGGTSSHYYLDAYLLFHGIDPKEVNVVALRAEQVAEAVEHRQVDAVAMYSRHASAVTKALGDDRVLLDEPRIYTEIYTLAVDRQLLAGEPQEVVKVLRALQRAEQFIADQPKEAQRILASRPGFDAAAAALYGGSLKYRLGLDPSLLSAMEGQARWAVREGRVPAASKLPDTTRFVDDGPLRTALPALFAR